MMLPLPAGDTPSTVSTFSNGTRYDDLTNFGYFIITDFFKKLYICTFVDDMLKGVLPAITVCYILMLFNIL